MSFKTRGQRRFQPNQHRALALLADTIEEGFQWNVFGLWRPFMCKIYVCIPTERSSLIGKLYQLSQFHMCVWESMKCFKCEQWIM